MTIKEGVHCTSIGQFGGLGDYISQLRAADKPISIQSVDSTVGVFDAQHSGEHIDDGLVFRRTKVGDIEVDRLPVDNATGLYTGNPEDVADYHLELIDDALPKYQADGSVELDFTNRVWTCSINEPSRNLGDIDYLARYTLRFGERALLRGIKYLAYGWSTGTPEPEFWEHPITLEYLRLCEKHPTMLGVSIHEYSLDKDDIKSGYPYLLGRVENLLNTCDKHGIAYPYIHIGEFGWEERHIDVRGAVAESQLEWADVMYKSLGINPNRCVWTLGNWHNTSNEVVADVIALLPLITERCVTAIDEPESEPPITGVKVVIVKIPQEAEVGDWLAIAAYSNQNYKRTQTASNDDMLTMLANGNKESYAIVFNSHLPSQQEAIDLLITNQYNYEVREL